MPETRTERESVAVEVDTTDAATRTGWGEKTPYLRVRPASVTGRLRIPDDLPFTWWG